MPQCLALDELLRHDSLDVGGLVEQRVIFHEMISAAPLREDVSAKLSELGDVTVETPGN